MTLLADIERFLTAHDLAASTFGDEALGDRHFVRQLRGGRRVWPDTETKVRAFMAERSESAGGLTIGSHGGFVTPEGAQDHV